MTLKVERLRVVVRRRGPGDKYREVYWTLIRKKGAKRYLDPVLWKRVQGPVPHQENDTVLRVERID